MRPAFSSEAPGAAPLLSFAGVSKRYPDGNRQLSVLEDVSFDIEAGSSVGLYGPRRSGKSTLLRLAAAVERPDEGAIYFEGRNITRISSGERARLLRTSVALLTLVDWVPSPGETVVDHVAMSLGSEGFTLRDARRRALSVLDEVGVAGLAEERSSSLSFGDRSRVMLARALVREPRLMVVDEPAPMPSIGERERFCALLRGTAQERGIALLVGSEDITALQGLSVLMSISAGEVTSTDRSSVIRLPRRRASPSGAS
jgi:ABC-type lipoprotein export system ATPase subunit